METTLDGIAVVTGAASGIGRDCVFAYAASGVAGIVIADIDVSGAQRTASESQSFRRHPSYRAIALAVNVSQEDDVNSMVEKTVQEFGRIDYAVNSAGVSFLFSERTENLLAARTLAYKIKIGVQSLNEIAETSLAEFDAFFNVNVKGTLLFAKAISRVMKTQSLRTVQGRTGIRDLGRGVIINIGSCNSYVPIPGIVQYTAAKHALLGITKNAALDNAPYGIRVNAVCPSWVKTPMMDAAFEGSPPLKKMVQTAVPMGRIAQQEEVSDVVIFLSGPGGSYVTGVGWIVDGGTTLQLRT